MSKESKGERNRLPYAVAGLMMSAYSCFDLVERLLPEALESFWLRARMCQMAQQCIELCFKGVLEYNHIRFPHSHDLNRLQELLSKSNLKTPVLDSDLLDYLTAHAGPFQYNTLVEAPSEKSMDKILDHCQKAYEWAEEITGFNPKDYTIPIIDL